MPDMSYERAVAVMMAHPSPRQKLSTLTEAYGVLSGMGNGEMSRLAGCSPRTVARIGKMSALEPEYIRMVDSGELVVEAAHKLALVPPHKRKDLADAMRRMSVREVREFKFWLNQGDGIDVILSKLGKWEKVRNVIGIPATPETKAFYNGKDVGSVLLEDGPLDEPAGAESLVLVRLPSWDLRRLAGRASKAGMCLFDYAAARLEGARAGCRVTGGAKA